MLSEKGGRSFPYLVYLDAEGKVLAKIQNRSIEGFAALGKHLKRWSELSKKSDPTKAEKVELWGLKLKMGKFSTGAEARTELAALEVSDEERKKLEHQLADLDVMETLKTLRRDDKAGIMVAGKKFAGWAEQGRIPTGANALVNFWSLIMEHAKATNNPTLFERGLNQLKAKFGKDPRAKRFFQAKEAELQQLKAASGGK